MLYKKLTLYLEEISLYTNMQTSDHYKYGRIFVLLCFIAFVVSRSFPFRFSIIPLGYDPGLYRSMFFAYEALGHTRIFENLPQWIQSMYEPLLGMQGVLLMKMMGGWSDYLLTRGIVFCGLLVVLGIWFVARRERKSTGFFAILLAIGSFTQYHIFWRHYRKQLLAMFFLLVVIGGRNRSKLLHMIPLISGIFLLHRPAAVVLLSIAVVWGVLLFFRRQWKMLGILVGSISCSFLLTVPLLFPFREDLFLPLIGPFFSQIDMPVLRDGFQQGGTFLTMYEYLFVAGGVLLLACGGIFIKRKNVITHTPLISIACVLLFIRVFGQGFFFQRMIGYFDVFIVLAASSVCAILREGNWMKRMFVIIICLYQVSTLAYRTYRTYRPLIEPTEFAFLSQIGRHIEPNAHIIVPGIDYSPRVQGRTQREVLAPGLFTLNRRGTLDQERTTKWLSVPAAEKCSWLERDYPELRHDVPVYLRIGSKQPFTEVDGACFFPLEQGPGWSWWKRKES